MGRIKFPKKRPTNIPYEKDGSVNQDNKTFNEALDLCIAAEKESRLSPEDIEEIIDQVYDCDHNGQSFVSNWKQLATAIHQAIYGEGEGLEEQGIKVNNGK